MLSHKSDLNRNFIFQKTWANQDVAYLIGHASASRLRFDARRILASFRLAVYWYSPLAFLMQPVDLTGALIPPHSFIRRERASGRFSILVQRAHVCRGLGLARRIKMIQSCTELEISDIARERNGRNPYPSLYDSIRAIKMVGPGSILWIFIRRDGGNY